MAIAQSTELRSRRLTGRIGAEISGVDLARLDDSDVAAIRQRASRPPGGLLPGPDDRSG